MTKTTTKNTTVTKHSNVIKFVNISVLQIRLNKLIGCFALDTIKLDDSEALELYGLGKELTIAVVSVDTGLVGTIGAGTDRQFALLKAVVLQSDSNKLMRGLLISFACKGQEMSSLTSCWQQIELAQIVSQKPKVLTIKFDREINTKYNSIIKPPSFKVVECPSADIELYQEAQSLPRTMHLADYPGLKAA